MGGGTGNDVTGSTERGKEVKSGELMVGGRKEGARDIKEKPESRLAGVNKRMGRTETCSHCVQCWWVSFQRGSSCG